MNRRQFLQVTVSTGTAGFAGCAGGGTGIETGSPAGGSDDADKDNCANNTSTHDGPHSPYDYLSLHQMPEYVTAYSESVIVQHSELGVAAQRAVRQALASDEGYRECTSGREQTDVMALSSSIERRWEQGGGESFDHTYLHYRGAYYGIMLVLGGDAIRVNSIPCTEEECPTTPTPRPEKGRNDSSHD